MNLGHDLRSFALCATAVFTAADAFANPAGMTVAAGNVSATVSGSTLNITASQNAFLNWKSFNIAANETVNFQQPSATSVVWNRILDSNPSQIFGHLNANGYVVLMNQNGFYFGPNSCVNVGGFIAAGAFVNPPANAGGAMWTYQGPPPSASIINYGEIKANNGGSIFLVAEKIENHGVLTAPDGTLGLYAGKEVMLSERPDGRGLSASVTLPDGSVDNLGKISADAGTIALRAKVVNQGGMIQANSVRDNHGVIELVASDAVNLGADSVIQANGDDSGASAGGSVTVKSSGTFSDASGSQIQVRGGANGGHGGAAEISADKLGEIHSQVDGTAQSGFTGGTTLIDPADLTLDSSSLTPFVGQAKITFAAIHDITLADFTTLNLGSGSPGSLFTLKAGNDINFGNTASIVAGAGWSVSLYAGVADVSATTPVVQSGVGGIYDCTISSQNGDITLKAGHEVQVQNGYLRTFKGGNIYVTTGDGDVNAGISSESSDPATGSDHFLSTYSKNDKNIDSNRSGIATEQGGNVTIDAGGNIDSSAATTGALGVNLGNVSLTAAGDILGSFYLGNGTGIITAKNGDVGDGSSGATLGLTSGSWSTFALNGNIYINEVYNFNGLFSASRLFNYASDASVTLVAGNSVQLIGNFSMNDSVGKIYAPKLTIEAGPGGVMLGGDVVLFPSAQGSLDITTTHGGSLTGAGGNFYRLKVSDGDRTDYRTFADGHAATPVHLGEGLTDYAVNLSIDGDVDNIYLRSPGVANIYIHGNANNFAFEGQNLAAGEVTKITLDGNYSIRKETVTETVTDAGQTTDVTVSKEGNATFDSASDANLDVFQNALISTDPALGGQLYYNSTTHQLGFYGQMTANQLKELLNPTVIAIDPVTGVVKYDSNGNPLTKPAVFTTDTTAILALYRATQDLPLPTEANDGLVIHGPGKFQIAAHNMDLGSSSGIVSYGAYDFANNQYYQSLGKVMVSRNKVLSGADIELDLSGSLDMTSSKIYSSSGGSIAVYSQGDINLGQQDAPFADLATTRGIYTGHGGDVTVEATLGDVNVNGSRIAAYDGGNVTVTATGKAISSKDGSIIPWSDWSDVEVGPDGIRYIADASSGEIYDKGKAIVDDKGNPIHGYLVTVIGGHVNAGDGAKGLFYLNAYAKVEFNLDQNGNVIPSSIQVIYDSANPDRFFGSGIIAMTGGSTSSALLGNISVTADADIQAGTGGILQLAFNNVKQSAATLDLHSVYGDINAGQSGVLGKNVSIKADHGSVEGLFIANGNADIQASKNVDVTAIVSGNATVGGGGTVSGTIIGGESVSVSGAEVTASAISTGGSVSGSTSGETSAFAGVSGGATQKNADDASQTVAAQTDDQNSTDDERKKRGKSPVLAQKISRVTVILPKKS